MRFTRRHYATRKRKWLRLFGEFEPPNFMTGRIFERSLAGKVEANQKQLTNSGFRQMRPESLSMLLILIKYIGCGREWGKVAIGLN